jgi:HEAT repeat protein
MTDASGHDRPDIDALSILAHGSAGIDQAQVRAALGLRYDSTDEQFAHALVQQAARAALPALQVGVSSAPPRQARDSSRPPRSSAPPRSSIPPRLAAFQGTLGASSRNLQELDNLHTLLLIARAAGLFMRRAAVARVGELLLGVELISAEQRRQTIDSLRNLAHAELAFDIGNVLAALPGGEGRSARTEQRLRQDLAGRVQLRVLAFWEGEHHAEPFTALSAEERASLLPQARALSDVTIRHLSALLEDSAAHVAEPELRVLLMLLEHAGDARLLPALRSVLDEQTTALFEPCVRALASIDDPRVPGLLGEAFERATRTPQRLLLAAALGRFGDARGLGYARYVLREQDPVHLAAAVDVLSEVGGKDDVQRIIDLLEHPDPRVMHSAIRGLERIGDSRALPPLAELRSRVEPSAKRADIEDAESAIAARAELLGEALPSGEALYMSRDTRRMVAIARARDPALLRFRARLFYSVAVVCSLCGAARRANSLFEAASALLPGWLAPVRALALLHARRKDIAAALAAFRRALDIDRTELESDTHAVSAMATTFLRRAEAVEREGRLDIARGLVDEALSYDLRRAGAEVRLALSERREALLAREHA